MHWRRFAISEIPLDDQKEFEVWLTKRWAEKDELLDHFFETGRFPTDDDGSEDLLESKRDESVSPAYIETEVKLGHWIEATQIFVVLGILALFTQQLPKLLGVDS
jgi:hypothetical protein